MCVWWGYMEMVHNVFVWDALGRLDQSNGHWPVFLVSRRKDSWMISSTIVQHFVQVLQNLSNVSNDSEEGE